MEDVELRLLRCLLGGSRDSIAESNALSVSQERLCEAQDGIRSNEAANIEDCVREVLEHVECGRYARALAAGRWSGMLGEFSFSGHSAGKEQESAEQFYSFLESRMSSFIAGDPGLDFPRNVESCGEGERKKRDDLLLCLGVAALCAFIQVNMTGPVEGEFPACPVDATLKSISVMNYNYDGDWDAWARIQLMVDGCDFVGKISLPQYLLLSKLLLISPLEGLRERQKSRSWWEFRVLLMQQRVLGERSPSLRTRLALRSQDVLRHFGTADTVEHLGWKFDKQEANRLVAAAQLEIGLMEQIYGYDDAARSCFNLAAESCGLEMSLTGVLGSRTRYQAEPTAQMVLVSSSQLSKEDESSWLDFVDMPTNNVSDLAEVETEETEVHLAPKLVSSSNSESSLESDVIDSRLLSSIEQAIILALAVDVRRSNPDDELRSWQMAPYIEAVDVQRRSHPVVKSWCHLLRVRWEKSRVRTRERSLSMMEQLVNDTRGAFSKVSQRMAYALCVGFPVLPALLEEYADLLLGFGLVGNAMELFKHLELWNRLIDCYSILGKKTAAAGLIKDRLEIHPDDPRLWCSLGDVTMDDDCYLKAWEVSNHRFTRAQRSLARTAYTKGAYSQAIQHWDLALSLNPLHPDGWFALGSAALKARDLDKALGAFTRQVQLDPENGESWNNIAAINMQNNRNKEAFVAFREALKFKRSSWQIWENFGHVALALGNFGQTLLAVKDVLELSEGKRIDVTLMTRLVEELERRKGFPVQTAAATTDGLSPSMFTKNAARSPLQQEDGVTVQLKDTDTLLEGVGKILSRIVAGGSTSGEVWDLKARWHRLKEDTPMYIEARLKQVRTYQGTKWKSSPGEFETFARACLQLCEAYLESVDPADRQRNLYSSQMLLRNTIKQAEQFSDLQSYKELTTLLDIVESSLQQACT